MIKHHTDTVLEISAHDPATLENDLNAAVEIVRERAMEGRSHGILVTQRSYARYTVEVSRDVPFGQTHERRESRSDAGRPHSRNNGAGPGVDPSY